MQFKALNSISICLCDGASLLIWAECVVLAQQQFDMSIVHGQGESCDGQ